MLTKSEKLGQKFYPPTSSKQLIYFINEINKQISNTLKKTCIIYYILKDYGADDEGIKVSDYFNNNGLFEPEDIATNLFFNSTKLPENYKNLIDGLYNIDNLEFDVGLSYLIRSNIQPTYYEEIISYFAKADELHQPRPAHYYILTYISVTHPPLNNMNTILLYVDSLISNNMIFESFKEIRALSADENNNLKQLKNLDGESDDKDDDETSGSIYGSLLRHILKTLILRTIVIKSNNKYSKDSKDTEALGTPLLIANLSRNFLSDERLREVLNDFIVDDKKSIVTQDNLQQIYGFDITKIDSMSNYLIGVNNDFKIISRNIIILRGLHLNEIGKDYTDNNNDEMEVITDVNNVLVSV